VWRRGNGGAQVVTDLARCHIACLTCIGGIGDYSTEPGNALRAG